MKVVLAICCLLLCTLADVQPQQRQSQATQPVLTRTQIKDAEQRLADLGYWPGPVDGTLDPATQSALIAFQKCEGRTITGELTAIELEAIHASAPPKAREIGYAHVEVDLDRQVLLLVNSEGSVKVLPVSTGSGKQFSDDGQTSVAYTPRGRFVVYAKHPGWETGPLGLLYFANYISGGVAIHGSRNVPNQPESHGCIRIPVFAAREVSNLLALGTIILVYDKVSFVSAKDWVENPRLKKAALILNSAL